MKRASIIALSLSFISFAALAQTNTAPVTEGSAFAPPPVTASIAGGEAPAPSAAQLEIRLSNMEDELRALRGKNEESEFQIRKMSEAMEKMQRDFELRMSDLEGKKPTAQVTTDTKPAMAEKPDAKPADPSAPLATPVTAPAADATPKETTAGDGVLRAPDIAAETSPRDLYNSAFRLLNQTKYEEAAAAFDTFTKKYPKDPLIGNAYYWQGETFYIRRDYITAADLFRAGFEALPTGPKAPDNLLKLAMSLDALKRDKEACVVLQQVIAKFKKDSVSTAEKAQAEQKRMGCK